MPSRKIRVARAKRSSLLSARSRSHARRTFAEVDRGNAISVREGVRDTVELIQGDFMKLPFPDASFDAVHVGTFLGTRSVWPLFWFPMEGCSSRECK